MWWCVEEGAGACQGPIALLVQELILYRFIKFSIKQEYDLLLQMTIVEAYVGGKKLASPDSIQLLSSDVSSLLIEGIGQNTTGNVFVPEVTLFCLLTIIYCLINVIDSMHTCLSVSLWSSI